MIGFMVYSAIVTGRNYIFVHGAPNPGIARINIKECHQQLCVYNHILDT